MAESAISNSVKLLTVVVVLPITIVVGYLLFTDLGSFYCYFKEWNEESPNCRPRGPGLVPIVSGLLGVCAGFVGCYLLLKEFESARRTRRLTKRAKAIVALLAIWAPVHIISGQAQDSKRRMAPRVPATYTDLTASSSIITPGKPVTLRLTVYSREDSRDVVVTRRRGCSDMEEFYDSRGLVNVANVGVDCDSKPIENIVIKPGETFIDEIEYTLHEPLPKSQVALGVVVDISNSEGSIRRKPEVRFKIE